MRSRLLTLTGAVAAGAAGVACAAYQRDINAARSRIARGQVIDAIEFAEAGNGPAVLVVHGAGGGFDQGLDLGRFFVGDQFRIVAPSRFGYLGTPLPPDASPEAQADVHVRLLDALHLERVPVIGVSAGSPSAMQFALRHPECCSALVLIVPLAFAPDSAPASAPSPLFEAVLNAIMESDVFFWLMTKFARATLLRTILGTPIEVYRKATPAGRRNVDAILDGILPISRRAAGLANETAVARALPRYPLEEIRVPTLVISAEDCGYGTYVRGRYTAEHIPGAKFVGFPTGGHLLVGHEAEVRAKVMTFLQQTLTPPLEAVHS